ncbi:MAG: FAD-binding oxidoreductase [Bacteroidia bacterium]|nr:FAD-binding oxidoreductase [Bacteroidia bacterium]
MKVSNWGNYPSVDVPMLDYRPGRPMPDDPGGWIARGMGRCYGDSALGSTIVSALKRDRILAFDPETGLIACEPGVTYADLIRVFAPRGWFPPVTPGTKFVSMGGALASDVHGKNHHVDGSVSRHVESFRLLTGAGEVLDCSRQQHPEVFDATMGGMGLTGFILDLTLRLKPIETTAIRLESIKARNLEEIFGLFDAFGQSTYSVAWIDTLASGRALGRSILMTGEHARRAELPAGAEPLALPRSRSLSVPVHLPAFTLNRLSIGAFNTLYYAKQLRRVQTGLSSYEPFFYPLDAIHHWNRIYGRRGFTQYQFVVPKAAGQAAIREALNTVREAGFGSFLSVLKLFGPQAGMMAFPMEGYTLTLDFPISRRLFPMLDRLDALVAGYGGRVYLTKDVRLGPEMLARMYPRLPEFKAIVHRLDPEGRIRSLQSDRLKIKE